MVLLTSLSFPGMGGGEDRNEVTGTKVNEAVSPLLILTRPEKGSPWLPGGQDYQLVVRYTVGLLHRNKGLLVDIDIARSMARFTFCTMLRPIMQLFG
jgi:hypothetical protein